MLDPIDDPPAAQSAQCETGEIAAEHETSHRRVEVLDRHSQRDEGGEEAVGELDAARRDNERFDLRASALLPVAVDRGDSLSQNTRSYRYLTPMSTDIRRSALPCPNLSQRSGRYRDPISGVGRELALCLLLTLFVDLPGDSGAKLKLRTAGTSKQPHEYSREQLPALALVPIVTASITMAGAVGDQQFLLSTQPCPVQLGDWDDGPWHRPRQKRDIRRN